MIKMKKTEILIKGEGDTLLSFHVSKYWLQISDNHTTELAAWACVRLFVLGGPHTSQLGMQSLQNACYSGTLGLHCRALRGARWATVHRVAELATTEATQHPGALCNCHKG